MFFCTYVMSAYAGLFSYRKVYSMRQTFVFQTEKLFHT